MKLFQEIWAIITSKIAPAIETGFSDYEGYENGQTVTSPLFTTPLAGGRTLGGKFTVTKKTVADSIDLETDLAELVATQAPELFTGEAVTFEPFTIAFQGEFAEITLTLQIKGQAPAIGVPAGGAVASDRSATA